MSPPREPRALDRLRALERSGAAPGPAAGGGLPGARPSGEPKPRRGVFGSVLAGIVLLLVKGKALLLLLATKGGLLLSALKLGKLAATVATMGVSLMYYAGLYRWGFALGLVTLILVHEMGHGVAAMRLGLRVGAPIFIPGFGAVIALKDQPRSTWANAVVGYGGPLAGTLGGIAVLLLGPLVLEPAHPGLSTALAHFTFLMNFFNLIPVGGLDGDRITEPLTGPQWAVGLAVTALVMSLSAADHEGRAEGTDPQIVFAVAILLLGTFKAIRVHRRASRRDRGDPGRLVDRVVGPTAAYTDEATVEPRQRRAAAIAYFGLVAALIGLALASVPSPR